MLTYLTCDIIELSTVYYLAFDIREDHVNKNADIIVVDPSSRKSARASGQNEGVIGELAYNLHAPIAAKK